MAMKRLFNVNKPVGWRSGGAPYGKGRIFGQNSRIWFHDKFGLNALTDPSDFNAWAKVSMTLTSDSTVAPDGTTTADTLDDQSAAATSHVRDTVNEAVSNNDYCIHSVYVQKDAIPAATRYMQMRTRWSGGTVNTFILNLDTSTGDISTARIAGSGTDVSSKIELINGYWRIEHITRNDATGNNIVEMRIYPAINNGAVTQTGTDVTVTGAIVAWLARRQVKVAL